MADLQFKSLRHQISHMVHAAREPLTKVQLMPMCTLAADGRALSQALYQMSQADQLTRHPEEGGSGVIVAYGPGKVKLGAIDEADEAGGGGATSPKARGRVKRPKKRIKGVQKVQRKTAKTSRGKGKRRRLALLVKRGPTFGVDRSTTSTAMLLKGDPRWALASDGAFVLLGSEIEIPKPAARALVDFVRALDAHEA